MRIKHITDPSLTLIVPIYYPSSGSFPSAVLQPLFSTDRPPGCSCVESSSVDALFSWRTISGSLYRQKKTGIKVKRENVAAMKGEERLLRHVGGRASVNGTTTGHCCITSSVNNPWICKVLKCLLSVYQYRFHVHCSSADNADERGSARKFFRSSSIVSRCRRVSG